MNRDNWMKVGSVLVDPSNPVYVGIAKAGAAAADVFHTDRARDEVQAVADSVSKRERKNAKRLRDAQRRGEVPAIDIDECRCGGAVMLAVR